MPINLKKTDIENKVDNPKTDYMVLGFDLNGRLVSKDSDGNYAPIVPVIPTGDFQDLNTEYFTVGYRLTGSSKGLYSIGQGINVVASGESSYAQGVNSTAGSDYSTAKGVNVSASGLYSYVNGVGESSTNPLTSGGINSFVHSFSNTTSKTLSDYSVILGGSNHNIGTSSTNSVILGGTTNIIGDSLSNVAIIACNTLTATVSDAVYVPRLVLKSGSYTTVSGSIDWNGVSYKLKGGFSLDGNIIFNSGSSKVIKIEENTTTYDLSILGQLNTSVGGVGGDLNFIGGNGYSATGAVTGGNAGSINITGGSGGNGSGTNGTGGNVSIIGGDSGTVASGGVGGNVYIYGGMGLSGNNGNVYIGTGGAGKLPNQATLYYVFYDPTTGKLSYHT
jgi:hypothetical protein